MRVEKLASGLVLLALLAACDKTVQQAMPIDPDSGTSCSLDGMVLTDYPGPKAQIHYAEGTPEFFCDLMELFATLLEPEQKRKASGIFVQDMGKTSWERPERNWIDARSAVYVAGSKKTGSMGPTFGSFATLQDAEEFVKKEGGKIVRFEQVTLDMVNMQPGAAHDGKVH